MSDKLITFEEAIKLSSVNGNRHLLTGNGFSIACRNKIFTYESLFKQADFSSLSQHAQNLFQLLNTKDFEIVMRYLRQTSDVLKIYAPDQVALIQKIDNDAGELKNILVNAIASTHPVRPSEITNEEYDHCKEFLEYFNHIYTLNYDLLLYWTCMHTDERKLVEALISGKAVKPTLADDGFRTPDSGKEEYVTWDINKTNNQNVFYLHGALHLFDAEDKLKKYTWINTGVKLIDQIRSALDNNLFPLFVSEGKSIEKVIKINHSNYLSRGFRSFSNLGGSLFIYGHSLAVNDSHILNLIPQSKVTQLFVSIYGDINDKLNQEIVKTARNLASQRNGKKALDVYFYDSSSAKVWR